MMTTTNNAARMSKAPACTANRHDFADGKVRAVGEWHHYVQVCEHCGCRKTTVSSVIKGKRGKTYYEPRA